MRKRVVVLLGILGLVCSDLFGQEAGKSAADSVVIRVGASSKVIFAIDKADLETLKYYDFQALMQDMIRKLEADDTTMLKTPSSEYLKADTETTVDQEESDESYDWPEEYQDDEDSNDDHWERYSGRHERERDRGRRRTHNSLNFDLGMNNLLSEGKFPDSNNDQYTVKPWGSWYVGINSTFRTQVSKKFFLEWGGGISWYNFKFQDPKTLITKDPDMVVFSQDPRDLDFTKSKLTVTYINASFVPVLDFGNNRRKPMLFDNYNSDSFRIGLGPYIGYRIDSYTKQVYEVNGDKEKEKNHDGFFIENIRYGARFQVGFRDFDLFLNYDMNELFSEGRGPNVNAFSFGVTF